MLSFDFCLRSLMYVPPAPFVICIAVRRLDFEQGRPQAALVGRNLAKIKLRVQRRMRREKPIWASI
jgi:hypothetical protein